MPQRIDQFIQHLVQPASMYNNQEQVLDKELGFNPSEVAQALFAHKSPKMGRALKVKDHAVDKISPHSQHSDSSVVLFRDRKHILLTK